MKTINSLLLSTFALIVSFSASSSAQTFTPDYSFHPKKAKQYKKLYDGPDFVVLKDRKDTIFCDKVEMKMSSNDPVKLSFQLDGRDTVLKWKECLNAIAFKTEGAIMELLPKNPDKPHKGGQHMFRTEEGYITIWSNNHKSVDKFKMPGELGRIHKIQYILVSIDGGPLFIPSMKNYRKKLYPLYQECDEMNKSGFSDFFEGVIRLSKSYNETCGKD